MCADLLEVDVCNSQFRYQCRKHCGLCCEYHAVVVVVVDGVGGVGVVVVDGVVVVVDGVVVVVVDGVVVVVDGVVVVVVDGVGGVGRSGLD